MKAEAFSRPESMWCYWAPVLGQTITCKQKSALKSSLREPLLQSLAQQNSAGGTCVELVALWLPDVRCQMSCSVWSHAGCDVIELILWTSAYKLRILSIFSTKASLLQWEKIIFWLPLNAGCCNKWFLMFTGTGHLGCLMLLLQELSSVPCHPINKCKAEEIHNEG